MTVEFSILGANKEGQMPYIHCEVSVLLICSKGVKQLFGTGRTKAAGSANGFT